MILALVEAGKNTKNAMEHEEQMASCVIARSGSDEALSGLNRIPLTGPSLGRDEAVSELAEDYSPLRLTASRTRVE